MFADRQTPDLLRSRLQTSEFVDLFRKHRRKLRKVFTAHASGNGSNLCSNPHHSERHTIELKDLLNILKLAKLMGGGEGLSVDDVTTIFTNVKRSDYVTC